MIPAITISETTILETSQEARARVALMDEIERRLEWLEDYERRKGRIAMSLDEAIARLEAGGDIRRTG